MRLEVLRISLVGHKHLCSLRMKRSLLSRRVSLLGVWDFLRDLQTASINIVVRPSEEKRIRHHSAGIHTASSKVWKNQRHSLISSPQRSSSYLERNRIHTDQCRTTTTCTCSSLTANSPNRCSSNGMTRSILDSCSQLTSSKCKHSHRKDNSCLIISTILQV
jgi:hypothetical protein